MSDASRRATTFAMALSLTATLLVWVASTATSSEVTDLNASMIPAVQAMTPEELGESSVDGLEHADPTSGVILVNPPVANSSGDARTSYPITIPVGRDQPGTTPNLSLEYDSGGGSSWTGDGWSLDTAGEISVDTRFGVPMFCPRTTATKPACDNVESETYRLNGDLLMPSANLADKQPRIAERGDYTRKQEQTYDRITRHGDKPTNYYWEVRDKDGNVFWYGGYPDRGGNTGTSGSPGARTTGLANNTAMIAPSAILTDDRGNGFTWYMKAQRDIFSNLIRYEYDTVYYRPQETNAGTLWIKVGASQCTSDGSDDVGKLIAGKCAKHVYLTDIYYAGETESSNDYSKNPGEHPGYQIHFVRGEQRSNPVIDARGGFLDLDRDLLTRIEVRLVADGTPNDGDNPLMSTYDLTYTRDLFDKQRLLSVTTTGCAKGECEGSTSLTTRMDYYSDVADGQGFSNPVTYSTGNDVTPLLQGDPQQLAGYESGLGMSRTDSADGRVYLGFNGVNPTKSGSFGGSITVSGGDTRSLVEMLDINGDGLDDKVMANNTGVSGGTGVSYRLNTAKPGDTGPVTFGPKQAAVGIYDMPIQNSIDIKGALEAYFGIFASMGAGGGFQTSYRYFEDVNADGLPDYVSYNQVYFNHLQCQDPNTPSTCVPTFTTKSSDTRSPLDVKASFDMGYLDSVNAATSEMKQAAPPVDTIRRWVAPYDGEIQVTGTASPMESSPYAIANCTTGTAATVWIQLEDIVVNKCKMVGGVFGGMFGWSFGQTLSVKKGERLYFRVSPELDAWTLAQTTSAVVVKPTITYTKYGLGAGAQTLSPPVDPNGLSQSTYVGADDFTLAGRRGMFVGVPVQGNLSFDARIDKAATTDDLTAQITHAFGTSGKASVDEAITVTPVLADGSPDPARQRSVAHPTSTDWCVKSGTTTRRCYPSDAEAQAALKSVLFTADTGLFNLHADLHADAPVVDGNGQTTANDTFAPRLSTTSPINPQSIVLKSVPKLCYGACGPTDLTCPAPLDIEVFPLSTATTPRMSPFTPPSGSTLYDVQLDFDTTAAYGTTSSRDKEIWVVFKSSDGTSLAKTTWSDATTSAGHRSLTGKQVTLPAGKTWWVDVSFRSDQLYQQVANAAVSSPSTAPRLSVRPVGTTPWTPVTSAQFDGTTPVDYFGGGYRGWSVVGYRADEPWRSSAIDQSGLSVTTASGGKFATSGDACVKALGTARCTSGVKTPGTYTGTGTDSPDLKMDSLGSTIPRVFAFVPSRTVDSGGAVVEKWQGPRDAISATRTTLSAARLADVPLGVLSSPYTEGEVDAPNLSSKAEPSIAASFGVGTLGTNFGFTWTKGAVGYFDLNGDGYPDIVSPDSISYTDGRGGSSCKTGNVLVSCKGAGVGWVNTDTAFNEGIGLNGALAGPTYNAQGVANADHGSVDAEGGAADSTYGSIIGGGVGLNTSISAPMLVKQSWSDFRQQLSTATGDPFKEGAVMQRSMADVNADGLPDLVSTIGATPGDSTSLGGVWVRFNLGYSFSPDWKPWATGTAYESASTYGGTSSGGLGVAGPGLDFSAGFARNSNANFSNYAWEDVNGDGLLDALFVTKAGGDRYVMVRFGTGAGLGPAHSYGTTGSMPASVLAGTLSEGPEIRQDSTAGFSGGFDLTLAAGPLCPGGCYILFGPGSHYDNSVTLSDVDLTDINGDGMLDSVSRCGKTDAQANLCSGEDLRVRYNTQGRTGLLKKVTNPLGGSFTLDYQMAGNTTAHPDSSWVLSSVTVDDGRPGNGADTQQSLFSYATPRYDFVNREDLGFAEVVTRQVDTESSPTNGPPVVLRTTRETFSNKSVFDAGLPLAVEVYSGDYVAGQAGNLLAATLNAWDIKEGASDTTLPATLTANQQLAEWVRPLLTSVAKTRTYGGGEQQRSQIQYVYDLRGNPTKVIDFGDLHDPADDVTTLTTWSNCDISANADLKKECGPVVRPELRPAFWSAASCPTWVSAPAIVKVLDAQGRILRYRDASADLCGNLIISVQRELISGNPDVTDPSDPAHGVFATTRMQFDAWGNYSLVVYPIGANGKNYVVQLDYDPAVHTAVTRTTDFDLDPTADVDQDGTPDLDEYYTCGYVQPLVAGACDTTDLKTGAVNRLPTPASQSVGLAASAVYDARLGRLTSRKNANGNSTTYDYDALARLTRQTQADGGFVSYEYYPTAAYPVALAHNSDELHVGDRIDTATFVDGWGRQTQTKEETATFQAPGVPPLDQVAVSGYVEFDPLGRVRKEWQPTVGSLGALPIFDSAKDPDPPRTTTYNLFDEPTKAVETDGRVTVWDRSMVTGPLPNPLYNGPPPPTQTYSQVTETDPEGRKTVTSTDVRGNVRGIDDVATGKSTRYDVDALGQVLKVSQAGQDQQVNTYDLRGLRTSTTTQDSGRVTFGYDAKGNLVSKQTEAERALGTTVSTKYEYTFNRMAKINYPDNVLQNTPDVTFEWGGWNGPTTQGDNQTGRLVSVETQGVKDQTLAYDVLGNVTREDVVMYTPGWNQGTQTTSYDYDWLGRPLSVTLPDGEKIVNDYDAGGRLATVTGKVAGQADYRYLAERKYDIWGFPAYEAFGNATRTSYARYPLNMWLKSKVMTGSAAGGALVAAIGPGASTITVTESLAPAPVPFMVRVDDEQMWVTNRATTGPPGQFTYSVVRAANGTPAGSHASGASFLTDREQQDLNYTYDKAGNVTTYLNDLPADTPSLMGGKVQQTYTLDGAYRIKQATGAWSSTNPTSYAQTFGYSDPAGTMVKKVQTGTGGVPSYTYDPITYGGAGGTQHRVSMQGNRQFSYDPNGNVTQIKVASENGCRMMRWNADNRMTYIDEPNSCDINGTGGKSFYYDFDGTLTAEHKNQGDYYFVNPWVTYRGPTMVKNIFAGDDRLAIKSQDKLYFFHSDLQGSTNVVTDAKGLEYQHTEYFPDGARWVSEGSTDFRTLYGFAGEYYDEDYGTSDHGQRWLDHQAQVFYGADPAPMDDPSALVGDPGLASSFTFANNNSSAYGDPDGRLSFRFIALRSSKPRPWRWTRYWENRPEGFTTEMDNEYDEWFKKRNRLRAMLAYRVVRNFGSLNNVQDFADTMDIKPVFNFKFDRLEDGGLEMKFVLSGGFGPELWEKTLYRWEGTPQEEPMTVTTLHIANAILRGTYQPTDGNDDGNPGPPKNATMDGASSDRSDASDS